MMTEIKTDLVRNVVFDLGGVVIDLDRDRAVRELVNLGMADADRLLDPYEQRGLFLKLECGHITAAEFFDSVRAVINRPEVTDRMIQDAFNAFLVDLPMSRLQALRNVRKKGYRTFALSNTNPVMFHSWIADAFQREGLRINDYFDGVVASFQEGCCKPDHTIFQHLLERYSLEPQETLLLDDSPLNVEAARAAGMQAVRIAYTPDADMIAVIDKL